MDKKVQAQLAKNKERAINKSALQNALLSKMNTGSGNYQNIEVNFFPDHSNIYLEINQTKDLLNEQGL